MFRDDSKMNYGRYSRQYSDGHRERGPYHGRRHAYLGDTQHEPGQVYRRQHSREYGRSGGEAGTRESRYDEMYDISNYTAQPRSEEYGLPRSAENDLDTVSYYPRPGEGPYAGRERHYRYNMGYNPNYDNPEEGDRYRDFDSRGNYGYRHDASYGNEDAFRDFGDDRYGVGERVNRVGDRIYGHYWNR
jgi:hypothetical protein